MSLDSCQSYPEHRRRHHACDHEDRHDGRENDAGYQIGQPELHHEQDQARERDTDVGDIQVASNVDTVTDG